MSAWLTSNHKYVLMFLLNLAVVVGILYLVQPRTPRTLIITTPPPLPSPTLQLIAVQVEGAVLRPGVYELPDGSRLSQLLNAAGTQPEADLTQLNLARRLKDGEKISVPFAIGNAVTTPSHPAPTAAAPYATQSPAPPTKINLNTATVEELATLPHIGPALAQRIVEDRETNGPFKSVDDITRVRGIGDTILNDLRPLVSVE